jgi:Ca-activated chloride channel family protein
VFCFGIGTSINVNLLDLVTEKTRAVSEYVLPDEDIEEKVSGFFEKVSDPVLTDLKLKVDGAEWVRNRYPKDLPDVFRGDQVVVFGKYQKNENEGEIRLSGKLRGKGKEFTIPVKLGKGDNDNGFIAKLWAQRRVGYLLDQIRLHGESGEVKEEVAELARKYGIVTPYTSYLIIEDEERRNVPEQLRTRLVRPTPSSPSFAGTPKLDALADYDARGEESAGPGAVARAVSARELKKAATGSGSRYANEKASKARGSMVEVARPQTIGGKTFYRKDELWVDEMVQKMKDARVRKIAFGSKEYFDLLADNLELTQWLSVGPKVQVVVNGELIEITN